MAMMMGDQASDAGGGAGVAPRTAMFGAGCFWGVEAAFAGVDGVVDTAVGYAGGTSDRPTYEEVCSDRTGHAEVVQMHYDPSRVSYERLLEVFFESHNPTTLNRQGLDFGSQYRSVVFCYGPEQEKAARAAITRLTKEQRFPRPIVTQVVGEAPFHRAEEYHQKYLMKRGMNVCH